MIASEDDEELREMAREELERDSAMIPDVEMEIKMLLVPADPEDAKMRLWRLEAAPEAMRRRFCGDLFRMYQKFAERRGWQLAVTNYNEGTAGGYKEICFTLTGEDVYGVMKYESGVHRVQRVPATETQGVCIPRLLLLPCIRRRRSLTSKSMRVPSNGTHSGQEVLGAKCK